MNYVRLILGTTGVIFITISFFNSMVGLLLATLFLIISLIIYRVIETKVQEKYELVLVSTIVFLVALVQNLI